MSAADFETRYQADPDPWGYTTSAYERAKYGATLEACGPGRFVHALELGSSIGVFSELLAPRCDRLAAIDGAPTAVTVARRRLADRPTADVILGPIPEAIPRLTFDLVVASEVLYYLSAAQLEQTLDVLRERLTSGGRLVAVHWRPSGPERPLSADGVHRRLRQAPWLASTACADTSDYRLDVLERQ